jgi:hypothetical protein
MLAIWILLLALTGTAQSEGLDLGAPRLVPNLPQNILGQSQQAVTSGGVTCAPGQELCVTPLIGVDYRQRETIDPATALTRHDLNVRAGWRLSLFNAFEFSTSAKLPLLQAEQRQGVMTGDQRSGPNTKIRTVEQPLATSQGVAWGSDLLLKINNQFNLNLFYDYSKSPALQQGQTDRDERFGTRLEYKFK